MATRKRQAANEVETAKARLKDVLHADFQDYWLRSLASTSTANARTSTDDPLPELRSQLASLTKQVQEHKIEIIEVHKVDPVLEATLRVSIENLTKRIEALEKRQLERWDVALVFIQLLGGIGVIVGIVFGILKYAGK